MPRPLLEQRGELELELSALQLMSCLLFCELLQCALQLVSEDLYRPTCQQATQTLDTTGETHTAETRKRHDGETHSK